MKCLVQSCDREKYRNGYCVAHNARLTRLGDVQADRPLQSRAKNGEPMAWLLAHVEYAESGCLIWPFYRDDKGYASIVRNGVSTSGSMVMCAAAHGGAPTSGHETAHSCGNGHEGCIHPQHLRWATRKENGEDKVRHGRSIRGEAASLAKITQADVVAIKANLRLGRRQKDIAVEFGVSPQLISAIKNGHCWSWLDKQMAA